MKPTDALFESIYPRDGLLVIGLVAQVGTNLDDLCGALQNRLQDKKYEVEILSLSRFLASGGTRTQDKQAKGTRLRKGLSCQHALALCAIAEIASKFNGNDDRSRKAFIIRSLKRPEEIEALRMVYGEAFLAIGVHTPKSKRLFYLRDVKGDKNGEDTIGADENAADYFGQRIRDTFEFCDFFIKGIDPEYVGLTRALKLCFGSVFTTPSRDEYAMAMAYAASLRSADLSRQVGAAIMNDSREIVAVGANEVPRFGGGQAWEDDRPDLRDFAELKYDPNVVERDELINNFLTGLDGVESEQGTLPMKDDPEVRKILKRSGLLNITEFGRTVHAEMACLMSSLRNHIDVRGSTLYSTTYPCHNCVRHIIASGVTTVKYVEPYPKSRAEKLFRTSCSFWDDDYNEQTGEPMEGRQGLRLEPFIGIGPRKYHDLFAMKTLSGKRIERKDETSGKALDESTMGLQDLKWPTSHFGLADREKRAVEQLISLWDAGLEADFPEVAKLIPEGATTITEWKQHLDVDPEATGRKPTSAEKTSGTQPKQRTPKGRKEQRADRTILNVEEGAEDARKAAEGA